MQRKPKASTKTPRKKSKVQAKRTAPRRAKPTLRAPQAELAVIEPAATISVAAEPVALPLPVRSKTLPVRSYFFLISGFAAAAMLAGLANLNDTPKSSVIVLPVPAVVTALPVAEPASPAAPAIATVELQPSVLPPSAEPMQAEVAPAPVQPRVEAAPVPAPPSVEVAATPVAPRVEAAPAARAEPIVTQRRRGERRPPASVNPQATAAMASANPLIAEARRYLGTNPTGRASEWCGAFMDMVLKRTGHKGGGNLASAYARYGTRIAGPQIGAIAVMWRKGGGHVGIVSGFDANGNPMIISGNHNKRVAEAVYPLSRIYAYVMP